MFQATAGTPPMLTWSQTNANTSPWAGISFALRPAAANASPTVSLTSPAGGAIFTAPATVALAANAADTDGTITKVEFFHGGTNLIATVTAAPYTFNWTNVAAAAYTLTAKATDNLGAVTTSAPVAITVNVANAAPTVSLTAPANGATFTAPADITITADAQDSNGSIAQVEFFQGTTLIATRTVAPYSILWTGVPMGSYSLTARATDNLGAATTSAPVNVTVNAGVAQMYFIHADHLDTPRVITNQTQQVVWRWDHAEPFGSFPANGNPSGVGAFEFNLRFPGQYFDRETNLHYNYYRDYDPSIGRYGESDPIGLKGGLNTYAYGNGNPLALVDPKGLEVEVGVRAFYPIGLPLVRHCFVRFSGNNSNTLSFTPAGVGPDPNASGATYSPTIGPANDSCVRAQMLRCRDYAFFTNNCCDCVAYALDACGLSKVGSWPNYIPSGPFRQPPPPAMCGDQGCPFP